MPSFIKPSIGRVVWLKAGNATIDQPQASLITYVHSDSIVNLVTFNKFGGPTGLTSVILSQENYTDGEVGKAYWMPYQKAVAVKEDALALPAADSSTLK